MRASTPRKEDVAPAAPRVIGERYRVLATLGKGGAAQVYRVVDIANGRELALKLLANNAPEKLCELFDLEYQTLASFDHPHTVSVYEFGRDSNGTFYTMELLDGQDLGGRAPLSWRIACQHLSDASEALGLLHARRLIHRDVSPRNLWCTRDGRVKLIDFGALAPFGTNRYVIGTPPLMPPEALERSTLDQRTDLYAVGAVAYFLMTGQHAFPARRLDELPQMWQSPPLAPSECVAQLGNTALEPIPADLDALVLSLLQPDPRKRPSSTAEVLDRLHAMLGDARASDATAAEARLANTMFTGHARELQLLGRALTATLEGHGQTIVIESAPGAGRSRLLEELGHRARVAHATALHVDAEREEGMFGVASALGLALLDALPESARDAARPFESMLAHASSKLRERLEVEPARLPEVAGEVRVGVQNALCDWFTAVAQKGTLVFLVDGLERADDGSVACLLALARALSEHGGQLLLVCALEREFTESGAALRALLKSSQHVLLGDLSEPELGELLESVFGTAEHVSRLSARLFQVTQGNPAHALELCRQLVQRGAITFISGTWVLPREMNDLILPASREEALLARLERVEGDARLLAQLLSLQHGPLSPGLCRVLAATSSSDLLGHLGELLAKEVLRPSGANLVFAHEQLRLACSRELAPELQQRVRRAIAEHILASSDVGVVERAQAAVHLLEAGDDRGRAIVVKAALDCVFHDMDKLQTVAPSFEAALAHFRASGRSEYEQIGLLTALALAGYESDHRYWVAYGEQAVRTLESIVGLALARSWNKHLGATLSVLLALVVAAVRFLTRIRNPCVPRFKEALQMAVMAVTSGVAASSTCFDPEAASRYTEVLRPLAGLSRRQAGAFMYDFCSAVIASSRDRFGTTVTLWRSVLARLDTPGSIVGAPEHPMRVCRGGGLFALACALAHRGDESALQVADALDQNGFQMDRVYADQVRTMYYGYRGQLALYERFRQRAEHHAIQRGTAWQIETWFLGPNSAIAMMLHDAMLMKTTSEQMKRLGEKIPSLRVHARYMRGAYLLLRGKCGEALPWLEDCLSEAPGSRTAWARAHGVLARAYNQLGDHARAQAACERVLAHYDATDFEFPALNQIVLTELAIAEASLGKISEARQRIAALHAECDEHSNRLLIGHLHETDVEIALIARDASAASEHFTRMERVYRDTGSSSLAQRCDVLEAQVDALTGKPRSARTGSSLQPSAAAATTASSNFALLADRLSASADAPFQARIPTALRVLAASTRASRGALYCVRRGGVPRLLATLDAKPVSATLERWVVGRLEKELEDELTLAETALHPQRGDSATSFCEDSVTYRVLMLPRPSAADSEVFGLAVLGSESSTLHAHSPAVVKLVSQHFHDALDKARSADERALAGLE